LYRLRLALTLFTTPSRRLPLVAVVGTPGFNNNVVVANPGINTGVVAVNPGINNNINGAIIGPNGNAIVDTGFNNFNNGFNNNGKFSILIFLLPPFSTSSSCSVPHYRLHLVLHSLPLIRL
jgi:hypothetical protein